MATGNATDFSARLRSVLPDGWFPQAGQNASPTLDALLAGLSSSWEWLYGLLSYAARQTRIATATDVFLDMIALDYFGTGLPRRTNEADVGYRVRIGKEMLRPRNTRAALTAALVNLTGRVPTIFEPERATDTGGYGTPGMTAGTGLGYGVAGRYGSLALPYQAFVNAYRPTGAGIANLPGYRSQAGAYGVGSLSYASLAQSGGQVTDAEIYATIANTMPGATIAWTAIAS